MPKPDFKAVVFLAGLTTLFKIRFKVLLLLKELLYKDYNTIKVMMKITKSL